MAADFSPFRRYPVTEGVTLSPTQLFAICYLLFAISFELVGENDDVIATDTV